ncbi:MAG TPA: TraR/DksA C4-type zinc finger protein [Roseiflexaceae bacterium]|nr:TraR/DksA C4-type zinc finger protein [Roseiflexaceae bacterium]
MVAKEAYKGIRTRLEQERASLLSDIDTLSAENQAQQDDYGVGNHVADDASEVFTRERNLALRSNTQDLLGQVDAALGRLDEGSYGICARCGQEIPTERLEALPYAIYCISCQSQVEHER